MPHKARETVAVVGLGVVGNAVRNHLESSRCDVRVFDPAKGHGDSARLDAADVAFVCVPTPYAQGRGFDDAHVHDAVSRLTGSKTIVIKSTVLPGTTDRLQQRYPQHRFLFSPEFLREASAEDDFINPDRQIVGCTEQSAGDAWRVIAMLPRAPFERICSAREAEMAKYMANAFLAVKVIFANEMFDLCTRLRIPYEGARDIAAADPRIGESHLRVFDGGYRGYGGKCLPKDSKALLDLARHAGIEMELLATADRLNSELRAAGHSVRRRIALVPQAELDSAAENAA